MKKKFLKYLKNGTRTFTFLYKSAHSDVVFIISLVGMSVIFTNIARTNFDVNLIEILNGSLDEYVKVRDSFFKDILNILISNIQKDMLVVGFLIVSSFVRSWLILTKELRDAGMATIATCLFDMFWPVVFLFELIISTIINPFPKIVRYLKNKKNPLWKIVLYPIQALSFVFELIAHIPLFINHIIFFCLFKFFGKPKGSSGDLDGDKLKSPLAKDLWSFQEGMRLGNVPITGPAFYAFSISIQHWPLVILCQFAILVLAVSASFFVFFGSYVASIYGVK